MARDGDVVHFGKFYAGLVQAILDRPQRKTRGIFHAVQPLFFDGRHNRPSAIIAAEASRGKR